jgi:histidyl-tRNA synthetase
MLIRIEPMTNDLTSYRGTKDFLPEEQSKRVQIFSIMRKVACQHGFFEYETPILEKFEVFEKKTSEEILNKQIFSFTDQSGRKVVLRPEVTPCLARVIAKHAHTLDKPIRWFSLSQCFRYERPQKGRQRSFLQFNADILGDESKNGDFEIVLLIWDLLRELGFSMNEVSFRLNSRKSLSSFLESRFSISQEKMQGFFRLLDKREKLSAEEFECSLDLFLDVSGKQKFLALNQDDVLQDPIFKDFKDFKNRLSQILSNQDNLVVDPFLSRGFDYYTDFIFEVFLRKPEFNRALLGGGRYDSLIKTSSEQSVTAVGFGISDTVVLENLEEFDFPLWDHVLLLLYLSEEEFFLGLKLAEKLRRADFSVALKKSVNLKKTFRSLSNKKTSEFVLFFYNSKIILKNLEKQTQIEVDESEIVQSVRDFCSV